MEKIANIDRRIIYILLVAVIFIVLLRPVGLAIQVSSYTQKIYDYVNTVPEGSYMWLGFDFDASNIPELLPSAKVMIRQAFDRNIKIVAGGMWATAGDMASLAFDAIAPEYPNKKYGVDYINLGYRPGSSILLDQANQDAWKAFTGVDYYGQSFNSMPIMQGFRSMKDAKFIFACVGGSPGYPEYLKATTGPLNIPFMVACVSTDVSGVMTYILSNQIISAFFGMKGGGEYETLYGKPGAATAGMDAQSFAHALIIIFIIVGNVGYLAGKRKQLLRGGTTNG
jgi:hypothetical protein